MATQGLTKPHYQIELAFGEGLVGLVGSRAEPINVADACHHPHFKHFPGIGEESFGSFFGTPIIHQRQVLGILVIQQRQRREFDESEESFMVTLAAQLAVIFAHAKAQGMWPDQRDGLHLIGSAASTGVAVARAWWDDNQPRLEQVLPASCLDIDSEQERLSIAIELASAEFRRLRKRFDSELHKETLAIFDLFSHLLNDPMLRKDLFAKIVGGDQAEWAIRQVVEAYSDRFANMKDDYLKERAQDIRELGQRLLFFLHNDDVTEYQWDEPVVLLTRELTAAMLASIPPETSWRRLSRRKGGLRILMPRSSRGLWVCPRLWGVDFIPEKVHNCQVIVDGYRGGDFLVNPNRHVLAEYNRLLKEENELTQTVEEELGKASYTQDNQRIHIHLNAGLSADTSIAVNQGVDGGVGLYRTEVPPFLLQRSFPIGRRADVAVPGYSIDLP